ncbi:MAG: dTMP kinase [bacterium]
MSKGKFIVIDGSDGSGKGTQSEILIKKLESLGIETAYYDFPQYYDTFFGKTIGEFLTGKFGPPEKADPYMASLLYAGDRWQASAQIKKDLAEGKVVISNRFTSSSMAHQAGKIQDLAEKTAYLDWLTDLEFKTYQIPEPDLVLYLYVPLKISQQLLETKAARGYVGATKDCVESDTNYLNNSINEYLRLVDIYPTWQKIDCVAKDKIMSIEDIAQKIFNNIKEII